jgi:hypothetical protein
LVEVKVFEGVVLIWGGWVFGGRRIGEKVGRIVGF